MLLSLHYVAIITALSVAIIAALSVAITITLLYHSYTYLSPTGEEETDNKPRCSTTVKYVSDFTQLVLMYTTDISSIETHIPRILSLTKSGG